MTVTLGERKQVPLVSAKCAIVVNYSLPFGLAANAAAVVAASLGNAVDGLVGADVRDGSGGILPGIVTLPLPILAASGHLLAELRAEAIERGVATVDFTSIAQSCRTYEEYVERLGATAPDHLSYAAVGFVGEAADVARLTSSLPLLK